MVVSKTFLKSSQIARDAAEEMKISITKGEEVSEETDTWAQVWIEYENGYQTERDNIPNEINKKTSSYASAYEYNLEIANETIYFLIPFFLFLDALMMMIVGMALFKLGILDGGRETIGFLYKNDVHRLSNWPFYKCL